MAPGRGFRRFLYPKGDRTLIRSTCEACGQEIIGTVHSQPWEQSLEEEERQHAQRCRPQAARSANLSLAINKQVTDAIVRCAGRITSDTIPSLKAQVKPLFPESKRVVLDLTDVNYVDSAGLGAIIGLYVSAKFANCQLKVTYSNESLKKLFRMTRLDQVLAEGA
jgi:anti-anti-sigma factor